MEVKVGENDGLRYWGLWVKTAERWMTDDSGTIIAFMSPIVANAQYNQCMSNGRWEANEIDVKEFA